MNHGLENEKLPDFKVLHLDWGCGSVVLNLPGMLGSWVRTVKRKGGGGGRGERGGGSDNFWKLATGKNWASVFWGGRDKFSREAQLLSFSPVLSVVK